MFHRLESPKLHTRLAPFSIKQRIDEKHAESYLNVKQSYEEFKDHNEPLCFKIALSLEISIYYPSEKQRVVDSV